MQVCWVSDRLDLGHVGIQPRPDRLDTAATHNLIDWAREQAQRAHVPTNVLAAWGLTGVNVFLRVLTLCSR